LRLLPSGFVNTKIFSSEDNDGYDPPGRLVPSRVEAQPVL